MSELALQLIEKEKRERTGKLDLGNCGLTDFPEELFELEWLEELSFCGEYWDGEKDIWHKSLNKQNTNLIRIEQLPQGFKRLSRLRKALLGDNSNGHWKIGDFSALKDITSLEYLDLRTNQISDINFLGNLNSLKFLNLFGNEISDASILKNLSSLKILFLRFNKIEDISFIESLNFLQYLSLGNNRVYDIRFLEKLVSLEFLDLADNEIKDIRYLESLVAMKSLDLEQNEVEDFTYLKGHKNLQSLNLNYNRITNCGFLENLTNLQSLNLRRTEVHDIYFLENMKVLETLDISSNLINDFSPLKKMTSLYSLDVSNSKFGELSLLENLVNLQSLDLHWSKITDIQFLEKMTNLQSLDIRGCKVRDINILENLTALRTIDISENRINDVHSLVPLFRKANTISSEAFILDISLWGNPIINPPMNIVEQGGDAILDWFEQIEEYGAEPFYESKLMILGQGESGKTTFANLQLKPDYKVKPGKIDTTLGIVVHRGKEFAHNSIDKPNIKAHLWDFGGQDIQKMLHQFFITENCLYVLVSNKRAENAGFDYWFQIINLLGPRSSVIVLENPKGSKGSNENFALNKYRGLYPELVIETIEVNLSETRGRHQKKWGALNEIIAEKLSEMEIVNRLVPKKWGLVRDELEKLKGQKYISKDSFYKLCANPEIGLNHRQADWCLSYFRSLGDLVYFDDRDLCTHIFLDHNWLTQGMYYILSDKKIETSGGRFTRAQAYLKWDTNRYNEEEKAMLLRLLLKDKFDICYELTDEKDVFITPLLLPADKPSDWKYEPNLRFRYQYGFIPHGLFSRLIVKLHEKIDKEQHWKTGVRLIDVVEDKEVRAEVQQYNDPEENQQMIDIKINGDKNGCKQMLAFIRSAVDRLHKDFRNISVKEIVACNCETCIERMKKGGKPSFYEFEKLQKKILNRSYYEECEKSNYKLVNIGLILNDIVVENAANENRDSQLIKQLKGMGMSLTQITNYSQGGSATATSTSSSSSKAIATSTVIINIQTILGEVQSLKEDFEDERKLLRKSMNDDEIDVTIRDIEKAEVAIQEIEAAQSQNQQPAPKSANRLKRFIDDLSDEESTLHKGLKLLRKGKNYGVTLAETYNKIAPNIGLPSIPPMALDVIKKL